MTSPRTRALDELAYLATVEHALVVDYLQIHYALGGDLEPSGSGEAAERVSAAAQEALSVAVNQMRHVRRINRVLVLAGRGGSLERAAHVVPPSGPAIPVGRFAAGQFEGFPRRERSIAGIVDGRYAGLRSAVLGPASPFEGELLDEIAFLLDSAADHGTDVGTVADHLAGLQPSDHLRATRAEPADELERALLASSDRHYQAVVATLEASFRHDEELGGRLLPVAVSTMDRLNEANRLLVERGVVPRFRG